MSYTELEHGYQGLRSANRPMFYVGELGTVPPNVGSASSNFYRSTKRAELSDGCGNDDGSMGGSDLEGEGKQVLVGICAMAKKSQSKPMKEILTRLEEFEYIKIMVFPEEVILKESVEDWPMVDCLISFHSKGFPLDKAISYANLRNPFIINNLPMQYDIQDRRRVYAILENEVIEIPRYAVLDRDSADPKHHELVESEDHVEVNGITFNKPFVEKPVSAEDHNIYIYYPTSAGGGSQRLFRKIGSRSSVYSPESRVRKTGSYIYEDFMPTDGTDVKVYTVGPDYAHAEARKSPALDGKVERDSEGKEIRYPVILSNAEKLISRKVCLAFKQTVCGFDLLRANGQSFVCDVNGFSFVKNSNKYYDDCAKILGNMILRELAPTLHIPWSVPFQLDDPPIVPTTFGKMMELRCVVAVIRHGDRTPKQKMKVEVRHPKFFEIFAKYDGYKHGHVKLKRPKQLQEILDTARSLLAEIQHRAAGPELEEKQGKLEQLKSVLEMYGHFSGINRKVQMKYQPKGRPRGSSSDDDRLGEPSLVLILKWGGELTPAGRIQAEELGRIFRCMYPGGQGRHLSEEDSEMLPNHGEYAGAQGLGLLRLHSTFRHDLKIYASDEGRVQMTAAAFAKGLLALEGELTPILVQMVKSANTNGLLDNDCDSSKYQNMVKNRLHELLQQDREFTREDREQINPGNALSINAAMDFVKNPVRCCQHVHALIQKLMDIVRIKKDDPKTKDAILYHGETWELMGRRWGKIEKDFCTKNKRFDISKVPDIYDCIKYDLQHNNHTLQFEHAEELYIYSKYLADIVIPQEYGLTVQEKLTIGQGICTPLLKKIRADLQRNIEESGEETVNRLNPRYSHGVSSPGRHVRTRLYFTSESHVHSLLTVLRYGGLLDVVKDEQWRRAMEYVSMVSELNYMSQIVVMLYEDPTKDPSSEERFHVELHFSPGVNCCVQKNLPPGPGFRPHSRNESSHNLGETGSSGQDTVSQCSTRIEEEDTELGILEDDVLNPPRLDTSPPVVESDTVDTATDSPTTSRAIDMMDLDPNMMDEPYDSGFLQSSAPIPISARTVAGHEAARLGSQLAASQRQRRERETGHICEPRARSYDHQRQEKSDKVERIFPKEEASEMQELGAYRSRAESFISALPILGKPIILPHSISSPEFPFPLLEPIDREPVVTLHSIPLASPTSRTSTRTESHDRRPTPEANQPNKLKPKKYTRSNSALVVPKFIHSDLGEFRAPSCTPPETPRAPSDITSVPSLEIPEDSSRNLPLGPPTTVLRDSTGSDSLRPSTSLLDDSFKNVSFRSSTSVLENSTGDSSFYPGRSKEPNVFIFPDAKPPSPDRSSTSQGRSGSPGESLHVSNEDSSCSLAEVPSKCSQVGEDARSAGKITRSRSAIGPFKFKVTPPSESDLGSPEVAPMKLKRSRSLSPCVSSTKCQCYNCNVSELILQSSSLPAAERSNFKNYFDRELSHKSIYCSCYSLANLWQSGISICPHCELSLPENNTASCLNDGRSARIINDLDASATSSPEIEPKVLRGGSCPDLTFERFSRDDWKRESFRRSGSLNDREDRDGSIKCAGSFGLLSSKTLTELGSGTWADSRVLTGNDWLGHESSLDPLTFVPHEHHLDSKYPKSPSLLSPDRARSTRTISPRPPFRPHLQPQRSFSSPDTRPSIIQPDPTCTARRHRHSISGQMSYFKLLGYNVSKKLTGSANSLFSTAVISGSSSAPNLKDMVPAHASAVAAIEGFGGVPPIRPLETLHNALSLRQLDSFLEMMTGAPLFRTPASSPPKYPSPGASGNNQNLVISAIGREYQTSDLEAVRYRKKLTKSPLYIVPGTDMRNQLSPTSPNSTGWSSEPQSFLSSEPSSPAPTSTGECSMSISLISNDGNQPFTAAGPKFNTTPCLDLDFNDFCMNMDQERESRGSVSYTDYYSNEDGQIRRTCNPAAYGRAPHVYPDELPADTADDDDEHTLTLKQAEEQKKQDVKFIFEKQDSAASSKSTCKKIGRFRVESMEISEEDVRIKDTKPSTPQLSTKKQQAVQKDNDKQEVKKNVSFSNKRKSFTRSQSASVPRTVTPKQEDSTYKATMKQSSFSTMSDEDLEALKQSIANPIPVTPDDNDESPILTVAGSLKDSPNVTIGFNVQDKKNSL
ncbi:inositol hexakisphosphate and diphosphoinositol-pentakisphosphate kinase 1 isoform X3 [Prorops nasuta]|uniref:inositol hexakisphosphate and diphosphoinositol-pentakisphosphate kinase 1 isoform X3 n=1 Tax=Prorops nasuta TaxID=863751 RepID=UPI0034CE4D76